MKEFQESNLKLNHLVWVMGSAIRLMKRNGAQCAVLAGRTQSDAVNDVTWRKEA